MVRTISSNVPDQLAHQRVLVTGASGFLGSHLCRRLSEEGAEIHGISRRARVAEIPSLQWWQADAADLASVRRIFKQVRPDIVFHLSGLVTATPELEFVVPTFHSLLASTVYLLTVATEVGCRRLVLAGSLKEPGADHEEATPESPYGAAKWAGSAYARMFHVLYQTPVVVARVFMTYGPGQPDNKLIPYVASSFLRGQAPKLSSGDWEADWIYVDDVVEGLIGTSLKAGIEGRTVELGTGRLASVRTVVKHLVDLTGAKLEPVFGALKDRPLEEIRVADTARTHAILGWKAETSLMEGLERTVNCYRQHGK